jgi:hypothetical protein
MDGSQVDTDGRMQYIDSEFFCFCHSSCYTRHSNIHAVYFSSADAGEDVRNLPTAESEILQLTTIETLY